MVILAAVSTLAAADPQGTAGAQRTTLTPDLARSARPVTLAGLSGGTAISRVLDAKLTGVAAVSEAPVALSMFLVSAEAKTSAGAPCWSWATRSEDPAKLKVTLAPGWAFSNSAPIAVKVFFSEAAAKTVISPDIAGDEDDEDEPELAVSPALDPHAAVARTSAAAATVARVARGRIMRLLEGFRR